MKAIKNSKIVIIDDVRDEVEKLLCALNKYGVSFNYYYEKADPKNLPDKPLKNVRFLFLDFVLATDSQQDKTKISVVIGVLKKVISQNNGPYIILAWTKHDKPQDSLIPLFKEELMKDVSIPKPLSIIEMDKVGSMNNLNKIIKNIETKFESEPVIEVLLKWENNVQDAVTDVMNTLSEVLCPSSTTPLTFDEYSEQLNNYIEKHMGKFAQSLLGRKMVVDKTLLIASQYSLNTFLQDHIENHIGQDKTIFSKLTKRVFDQSSKNYTDIEKSTMNTSFSLITKNLSVGLYPGNIYKLTDIFKKVKCKKKSCYCNKINLKKKLILADICQNPNDLKLKKVDLRRVIPIMLDVTPVCDFANEKSHYCNLLSGVLWPIDLISLMKKSEYLYKPWPITYKGTSYLLTFNSNRLLTFHPNTVAIYKPVLRARKELLTDIHHWFSKQTSRPGKIEFN